MPSSILTNPNSILGPNSTNLTALFSPLTPLPLFPLPT